MLFLSHTYADKPVVEPVALRLREVFGEASVFYDAWSIQPGDGIIAKMNDGLDAQKFLFFFVSEQSLKSKMVSLEWQNALHKSTKGTCRIIPVRVDGCSMPPLLLQNLYIDMHAHGIEAAILQIVNVVQGNSSFTPQHAGFSNLSYAWQGEPTKKIRITISASHLMEPNPEFLILLGASTNEEVSLDLNNGAAYMGGFQGEQTLDDGRKTNCFSVAPLGGAITPQRPMVVTLEALKSAAIDFRGVMHRSSHELYKTIPMKP
jgi:hypothetical protein